MKFKQAMGSCLAVALVVSACSVESEPESGPSGEVVNGPDAPSQPGPPGTPEPADPAPGDSSTQAVCGELSFVLDGADDDCAEALMMQCESILGIINPDYLAAVSTCVGDGGDVLTCLAEGFGALEPKLAHLTLAEAFCEECALDVPGCEDVFFLDDEAAGVGVVTLPFSEELIAEVTAECTDGLTCALDFPSCAREVIEERLAGIDALLCVLDL